MEKVVYWRNLSNQPENQKNEIDIPKEKIEYQKPRRRHYKRRSWNFDNILFYSKILILILIVCLTIGIIEYIRRFDLTKAFILASLYLSVFISFSDRLSTNTSLVKLKYSTEVIPLTIYMIRFARNGELPTSKKHSRKVQSLEFSKSQKKVNTPSISIKPEKDVDVDVEKEEMRKNLKSRGNVFAFKEDYKLTKEERDHRDESLHDSGRVHELYPNGHSDNSVELHGKGNEIVYL